jgi:hypothetical protein
MPALARVLIVTSFQNRTVSAPAVEVAAAGGVPDAPVNASATQGFQRRNNSPAKKTVCRI